MASHMPVVAAGLRLETALGALLAAVTRRSAQMWFGSAPHRLMLAGPRAKALAALPRDFRPADAKVGQAILEGSWELAGVGLVLGSGGDPWNRPSPSRGFAEALHRFDWIAPLVATGEDGAREALRLVGEWRLVFGAWNDFSWSGEVLERRTYNLACAMAALTPLASELEAEGLAGLLTRHARQLLASVDPPWRGAERDVVAGVAACALGGKVGGSLLARAVARITRTLPDAVLADGGHASRSPEAGLELLLDLLTFDDVCAQRGLETPVEAARAQDRLTAAMRFFTLPDGRLACFQGGEASDPARIVAARAHDDADAAGPPAHAPHAGYQRMIGRKIQVMVDAGTPAPPPWSATACAQAVAIEVLCGTDRLITNAGWSARSPEAQAQRLTDAASTAALGHHSTARPLSGWQAQALGPLLEGGPTGVEVQRSAAESGLWLDLLHDGWLADFGLMHRRRLFLDLLNDELRGEDQFEPAGDTSPTRVIPYTIRFHTPPGVETVLARDNRSVLLRGPSQKGWWLRNDAVEVRVEPAIHFQNGRQLHTHQVVLMGHLHADKGGRVRWKLTAVE